MKRLAAVGLGLFLLGLLSMAARAEAPVDVEARLLKDLAYLTSDECEGRGINTKGINLAAEYVARQFQKAGLKPGGPDGTYFQTFTLTTAARPGPNNRLTLTGPQGQSVELTANSHFSASPYGSSGKADAPLVFAGYGITSADPKYDDYAGLDVAGKVVILLAGTPRRGHRYADVFAADGRTSPHAAVAAKLDNAARRKAAAVLLVNDASAVRFGDSLRSFFSLRSGDPSPVPVALVQRAWLDRLLLSATGAGLAEVESDIDRTLQPRSTPLTGWTCKLETDMVHTKVTVKNVIGVLEGRGALAKETVVIGAHYDHVGMGSSNRFGGLRSGVSGPGAPGGVGFPLSEMAVSAVHHGADDNASGTTALMEIARKFAVQDGNIPNGNGQASDARRLVFIAFTAEESGLIGSAYYCKNPVFPLKDTVAMLNMDMVGRLQDDRLMVGGLGSAKPFMALIDRLNEKHRFELLKETSGFGPSDHQSFYTQNIPVLKFFTGFHEQYHRPSDRVETINVPGLRRIADLVADAAAEIRSWPARPEYLKTGPFDRTKTLWSSAPSTGVLPNYADTKEGVLVEGVVNGTPAAKAGLKKGDRILALAGRSVRNPAEFHAISRALKPGEKIEAAIERDGKLQKVEIQLVKPPSGTADLRFGWRIDPTDFKEGLLLTDVPADSPAGKAGLKTGDRVIAIGGEEVRDQATLMTIVRAIQPGEKVTVTAKRDGKPLQVQVHVSEAPRPR